MNRVRLGDVCTKIVDGSHNPPKGLTESKFLMLSSKNIFNDRLTFEDPRFLTQEDFEIENKRTNIQKGDVLLTIVGTVGRSCVYNCDFPVVLQRSVAVLKPKQDIINSRYLMHSLIVSNLENESRGVAQKGIYLQQLSNYTVPLPSLDEQQKIAAHLDSIQSAIDNKKQQLQQLDELVKSKFVEMFGNPGINENNFGIVSITELSQNLDSKRKPVTAKDRTKGEFPYYGASGIVDYVGDFLFDEDILLISEDGANLIARSTPIAFSVKGKVWVNNHAHVLSFTNRETQIFVEFYFSLFDISPFVTGAAQPKLSQNKLNEIPIFNPPIELQTTFAQYVQKIDSAKSIIKNQLVDLQELLDSKMDFYFGE